MIQLHTCCSYFIVWCCSCHLCTQW